MSELTPCNYCNLRRIQRRAERQGKRVMLKPSPYHVWTGGQDVYLIDTTGERRPTRKRQWVAWMAEIPDHCVC